MTRHQQSVDPAYDAAEIQRCARASGLDLSEAAAESLVPAFTALMTADETLRCLDLGDSSATGDPWGRLPHDD